MGLLVYLWGSYPVQSALLNRFIHSVVVGAVHDDYPSGFDIDLEETTWQLFREISQKDVVLRYLLKTSISFSAGSKQ